MNKYQCLIVDDEPIARRILAGYLAAHDRVEVCRQAAHAQEARDWCAAHPVDLLLLDIQMPEETGLDFLRSLQHRPVTIFTTAFLDFALEGFELGVLDYLVKPIRRERFDQALQRAVEFLDLLQLQARLLPQAVPEGSIEIQSGAQTLTLSLGDITHVQGLKDYAILHTPARRHVVRLTMKKMEELLRPYGFMRVHKSFIVARSKLTCLHRNKIEFEEVQVPVGRRYQAAVLAAARG